MEWATDEIRCKGIRWINNKEDKMVVAAFGSPTRVASVVASESLFF